MRIDKNHTAAVVVDFQEKLMPVMEEQKALENNVIRLLNGLETLGVKMVVTQQYTRGLGETIPTIMEACATKTIIEKIRFSAYEDIKEEISEKKYVIVCGIEAHICVLQTVIDLAANGYIPVLVTDCISSRKKENIKMAIERAKQEGAILTTYEAILFELLEVAGTKESKEIQKIIK